MINLHERTELVNGLLNVQTQPGGGTFVQVYVPLTEEAADRLHHPTTEKYMPIAADLYYFVHGEDSSDRPPVVLLHGAGGSLLVGRPKSGA